MLYAVHRGIETAAAGSDAHGSGQGAHRRVWGEQSRDGEEYHPAIVAQATAILGLLTDGRFTLGLGSGERLNEHVIGLGWPGIVERHERLSEAVDIIQGLLKAELSNYAGKYFRLDNAKLYDLPRKKPLVVIAAGGPRHR